MKWSAWLLVAFVLTASQAFATDGQLDKANAWFKPALVENRSPLCPALLEEANRLFYSSEPQIHQASILIDDTDQIVAQRAPLPVTTHGKTLYLSQRTNPGCGSACETYQMFASSRPFETPGSHEEAPGLSGPTPAASWLTLLKSPDDLYHVVLVADGQLQLYTLTEDAAWDGVCKVDIQPSDLHSQADADLQPALQSVRDLQSTIEPIRQGAGDCGSLNAHGRGEVYMRDALDRALYRPWSLWAERDVTDDLTQWSALGFEEYSALAKFRTQRSLTVDQLSRFYVRRFGWSKADAELAAEGAIAGALDRGFAFSSYCPMFKDGSLALRLAILENRPVAELDKLQWQPGKPEWPWWSDQESPLSVAVKHPDALRWLLSKQLDPNQANAFGKTPLMYAAQHNALAAVQILLAHGANPNAATIFPDDTCNYTLRRANVTALHYAVRYGSAEIVKTLLDAGALPFVRTDERGEQQPGKTPLDWLEIYASPNISDADRRHIAPLLAHMDRRQLIEYATERTLQAEKQYAAGDLVAAHRSLQNALQASPSDARALSDMSLVALRINRHGESLEAATRLIAGSTDARLIANAWFNIGLACEQSRQRYLSYNGEHYCTSSGIFPFLQSWRAANSRERAEKLEQLFAAPGDKHCSVPQPDSTEHRYIFVLAADRENNRFSHIQKIYVLHPAGSAVSEAQIRWYVTGYGATAPRPVTPRLVGSHRLGRSTLTVLESEEGAAHSPVSIGDHTCF
jgi:hypothetical protein